MAVELKNLTKSYWANLKKDAGIAKSSWYKKADANVGPAITKLEKARAGWKKEKCYETFLKYVSALESLDKSFDKFVDKKDVESTAEKKNIVKEIMDWKKEVADKLSNLKKKYPLDKLKKLNEAAMDDRAQQFFSQLNIE